MGNRSVQGKQANVQRLKEYKANLVVFPRNAKKCKKGWKADASAEETAVATQITTSKVMPLVAEAVEVETRKITPEERMLMLPVCSRLHGTMPVSVVSARSVLRSKLKRRLRRHSRRRSNFL